MTADETLIKSLPKNTVAPHFVDSHPLHGDILAQTPPEVLLNTNFNLHADSIVTVTRDGEPVTLGTVAVAPDQLSMRATLAEDGADEIYQVNYNACWPDRSCHDGSFSFVVDSDSIKEYVDLRGQSSVTLSMVDGQRFDPPRIILSPGTTVTWVNDDTVTHFVNTDPHPSHNLQVELNSSGINPGESYSYTFEKPGAWGYHCSAHVPLGMTAQVVVQ